MLKAIEVSQRYRMGNNFVKALENVSLRINDGELVAVTGPSGCGKSTLLYTLGGLLTPTSGNVIVDEIDIYKLSLKERARFRREKIGFVFQTFELLPYLTAMENVMLPLTISNVEDDEQKQRAYDCLKKVGLGNRSDHKPTELSGGEQQRVSLARGIIKNPKILLADEPTGNLDKKTGEEIMNIIRTLNKEGLTVVIVTHDLSKVKLSNKIYYMLDGLIQNNLE